MSRVFAVCAHSWVVPGGPGGMDSLTDAVSCLSQTVYEPRKGVRLRTTNKRNSDGTIERWWLDSGRFKAEIAAQFYNFPAALARSKTFCAFFRSGISIILPSSS